MLSAHGFTNEPETEYQKRKIATLPQLQPHDIAAENALLGSLILDPTQFFEAGYLEPSDFFLFNNGRLFGVLKTLFEKSGNYDFVMINNALNDRGLSEDIGPGEIIQLINDTPTSYGAPDYARIIYQNSIRRQVINRSAELTQLAYNHNGSPADLVNESVGLLSSVDATKNVSGGLQPIMTGVNALLDRRETIIGNGGILPGIMTGIKAIDKILDGLEKKRLYLLAGRPGMGKSAFALQLAYNAAVTGKKVVLFSLEMSEEEIIARLISIRSSVPYKDILAGRGDDTLICQMADFISRLPILIDTTPGLTVPQIRNRIQKSSIIAPADLIIIDHGGLVSPIKRVGNSYNDTNEVAIDMLALPKQVGLPVICLLQLNRQITNTNDKRPQLYHLRDSGKWEENADGVLFVHREAYYNPDTDYPNLGEIIVAKNRAGSSAGSASVYVNLPINRFADLEIKKSKI